MTTEEKAALVEWCEWRIAHGSKSTLSEQTLKAAIITMAELTCEPVAAPEGWQLVPVEPTKEMVWAAKNVLSSVVGWESFKAAYRAMIAAAPTP